MSLEGSPRLWESLRHAKGSGSPKRGGRSQRLTGLQTAQEVPFRCAQKTPVTERVPPPGAGETPTQTGGDSSLWRCR